MNAVKLVLPALLATSACGVEKLDGGSGGGQVPAEIQAIFDESCANAGTCHIAPASAAQGLDLSSGELSNLVGRQAAQSGTALVEFGDIAGSYMAVKILDPPPEGAMRTGTIMPPPPAVLAPEDQALVLGWIAGADFPEPGTGGSGGGEMQLCSTEEIVISGETAIDAGMGAGQVPPDIGDALDRNCGCHLGTEIPEAAGMPPGLSDLTTLDGITMNVVSIRQRVTEITGPLKMPPATYCDLGDGTAITPEDQALLDAWLADDMPQDGATWTPP